MGEMLELPKTTGHDREEVTNMADINNQATAPDVVDQVAQAAPAQAPVATQPVAPALDTTNDRTTQEFQKLIAHNQQLKQQLELAQQNEALRQQLGQRAQQSQQFAQPQIQQTPVVQQAQAAGIDPRDFIAVDPQTGERFIDETKLRSRVSELEDMTKSSAQRFEQYISAQQQREIERMADEAYKVYPELNPANPGHDKEFTKAARAFIYDSMVNPQEYGNKALTPLEAANLAQSQLNRQPTVMATQTPEPNQGDVQAANASNAKAQAAAVLPGTEPLSRSDAPQEDLEQLRRVTRSGGVSSLEAIAKRLQGVPDHMGSRSDSDVS